MHIEYATGEKLFTGVSFLLILLLMNQIFIMEGFEALSAAKRHLAEQALKRGFNAAICRGLFAHLGALATHLFSPFNFPQSMMVDGCLSYHWICCSGDLTASTFSAAEPRSQLLSDI